MIKTFHIRLPLSLNDSFDLLCKSGSDITSWEMLNSDVETGTIVWKQTFWSFTGKAGIIAQLNRVTDNETSVTVEVHKPLQVLDPLKICDSVFRKLDHAWKKNIGSSTDSL